MNPIDITGMPLFPGIAHGTFCRGIQGETAGRIVLISQDEIALPSTKPAGFIVADASPFSHTMIGLLGLGVPTILITTQQARMLEEGSELLLDGSLGRVSNNPDLIQTPDISDANRDPASAVLMADGSPVNLCASVRHQAAAKQARMLGASAIGLVRSEFLSPEDGKKPDRTYYQQVFQAICEAAAPLPVSFRLLDVASDKTPAWMARSAAMANPLGLQGVRLYHCKSIASVIDAQLDALAELSNEFDIKVIIPFVVRLEEYDYWYDKLRQKLPDNISVGVMAETPASVLDISHLLDHANFVAIGCNDLMQCLYAADRDLPELRHYLDPYAPALYRLFQQVAEQAGQKLANIQLCGVLAQLQGVIPVLMGLGYRTFSVDAPFIPYLANIVIKTTQADCVKLAERICSAAQTREVLDILGLPTDRHPPFL